jgi:cytochrome c oxidase subunit 2
MSVLSTPRDQIENKAPKGEHYLLEVDRPLVVPVGKKVRILTTANDVIHNWSVPAFAVKTDAVPGFLRDTWFRAEKEGTYRGQCSSFAARTTASCRWWSRLFPRKSTRPGLTSRRSNWLRRPRTRTRSGRLMNCLPCGEKVYATNCAACHQANGGGLPPAFPALDGSAVAKGPQAAHIEILSTARRAPPWLLSENS